MILSFKLLLGGGEPLSNNWCQPQHTKEMTRTQKGNIFDDFDRFTVERLQSTQLVLQQIK